MFCSHTLYHQFEIVMKNATFIYSIYLDSQWHTLTIAHLFLFALPTSTCFGYPSPPVHDHSCLDISLTYINTAVFFIIIFFIESNVLIFWCLSKTHNIKPFLPGIFPIKNTGKPPCCIFFLMPYMSVLLLLFF